MGDKKGKFSCMAEYLSELLSGGRQKEILDRSAFRHYRNIRKTTRFPITSIKHGFNFYPSYRERKVKCYPVAFFISINGVAAQGKGHINFSQMMQKFYKHMNEKYSGENQAVGIFSNAWETKEYAKYHKFIEGLRKSGVIVEVYFISRGGSVLVDS